jgi:hypothetical protein
MFEEFSQGYYLGRLYVEPVEGDRAVMERDQHERANEQVYATGEGLERLDHPLVMKLDDAHFPVHAAPDIPSDTLGVPEALLEGTRVETPPALKEVFLAKAEHASQLLTWFGHSDGDQWGAPQ